MSRLAVIGRVRAIVSIGDDAWRSEELAAEAGVWVTGEDVTIGVQGIATGPLIKDAPPPSEPIAERRLAMPSLAKISAASGAEVVVEGDLGDIEISAMNGSQIDCSRATVTAAKVSMELSRAILHTAGEVTGYVAYQSTLTVTGGGDTSQVITVNAGRITTPG